jgi:hypothetical protein
MAAPKPIEAEVTGPAAPASANPASAKPGDVVPEAPAVPGAPTAEKGAAGDEPAPAEEAAATGPASASLVTVHAATKAASRRPRSGRLVVDLGHPFVWGFTATVGALVAMSLAGAMGTLSTVLVSIGVALFVALALDPLVRFLESHRMSRGLSITVVFLGFALLFGAVLAIVVPTAVVQITQFATAVPGYITNLQNTDWFRNLVAGRVTCTRRCSPRRGHGCPTRRTCWPSAAARSPSAPAW